MHALAAMMRSAQTRLTRTCSATAATGVRRWSRLVEYLETCAGLAAARGEGETAARISGAIDAALDERGAQNVPADARMRELRLAPARESLGDERLEALQREGRALTLEEVLDEVLEGILADRAHGPE